MTNVPLNATIPMWDTDNYSMNQAEIIIIAALAESNKVIGKNGKVPWTIPEDSQRFHKFTLNHSVIMGSKTWEYDLEKKPLINRINIVISSSPSKLRIAEDCPDYPFELFFLKSLEEALEKTADREKVFIAGGSSIYAQALNLADTLELTLVEGDFEGDTFFPEYQHLIGSHFEIVGKEVNPGFRFETYRRSTNL